MKCRSSSHNFVRSINIGIDVHNSDVRIENRGDVEAELDRIQPSHVLLAAGITGRPNIDWCEEHKPETIRTNVIGILNGRSHSLL